MRLLTNAISPIVPLICIKSWRPAALPRTDPSFEVSQGSRLARFQVLILCHAVAKHCQTSFWTIYPSRETWEGPWFPVIKKEESALLCRDVHSRADPRPEIKTVRMHCKKSYSVNNALCWIRILILFMHYTIEMNRIIHQLRIIIFEWQVAVINRRINYVLTNVACFR